MGLGLYAVDARHVMVTGFTWMEALESKREAEGQYCGGETEEVVVYCERLAGEGGLEGEGGE